jgi:XTP/dITP diphosphohydrolase
VPRTLYAATTNPGKLRDFSIAAAAAEILIESLPGLETIPAPDENALTFVGNACLKAEYYSRCASRLGTPLLVLADDSGLEVDALQGAPGVRSARYAQDAGYEPKVAFSLSFSTGANVADLRNNLYLLETMRGIAQRTAHYRCVLAAARSGAVLLTAEGTVEGEILTAPRGSGGFGYDPLFYIPELGRTMAEISLDEKHSRSHRGRAFRALLPEIQGMLG